MTGGRFCAGPISKLILFSYFDICFCRVFASISAYNLHHSSFPHSSHGSHPQVVTLFSKSWVFYSNHGLRPPYYIHHHVIFLGLHQAWLFSPSTFP